MLQELEKQLKAASDVHERNRKQYRKAQAAKKEANVAARSACKLASDSANTVAALTKVVTPLREAAAAAAAAEQAEAAAAEGASVAGEGG